MGALDTFREQNPDYAGVPDDRLADGLYTKFYADTLTRDQFNERVGHTPAAAAAPAPAAEPHYLNDPSMAPSKLGQNAKDIWGWVQDNRQEVRDFLAQTAGTTAGVAVGAPGGPAGMIAGAAAGNVLGKKASRYFGG